MASAPIAQQTRAARLKAQLRNLAPIGMLVAAILPLAACATSVHTEFDDTGLGRAPIAGPVSQLLNHGDDAWRTHQIQKWVADRCSPGVASDVRACAVRAGMVCRDNDPDKVSCTYLGVSRRRWLYGSRVTRDWVALNANVTLSAKSYGPLDVSFRTDVNFRGHTRESS
jgi:hypothetical protein